MAKTTQSQQIAAQVQRIDTIAEQRKKQQATAEIINRYVSLKFGDRNGFPVIITIVYLLGLDQDLTARRYWGLRKPLVNLLGFFTNPEVANKYKEQHGDLARVTNLIGRLLEFSDELESSDLDAMALIHQVAVEAHGDAAAPYQLDALAHEYEAKISYLTKLKELEEKE